jgi:pyruvate formate lyase activating enzyme
VWVRYVLVPGLTDDLDDIRKTAAFAGGLGVVERVDVLPFHQMGKYKWERLGIPYSLPDTRPPAQALVDAVCEIFRSAGLKAV